MSLPPFSGRGLTRVAIMVTYFIDKKTEAWGGDPVTYPMSHKLVNGFAKNGMGSLNFKIYTKLFQSPDALEWV